MIKKLGVVGIGVAAGLVVAAPFASATESHDSDDHGSASGSCNVTGGSAEAEGLVEGDSGANLLGQLPAGGNNALNIVCNDILNGNASGNTVDVDLAGGVLPDLGLPA